MTVSEAIEILLTLPQHLEIRIEDGGDEDGSYFLPMADIVACTDEDGDIVCIGILPEFSDDDDDDLEGPDLASLLCDN